MNHESLTDISWDFCIVGNGISSLWMAHWAWSKKKSVLWITTDTPYSSERALLQNAWQWGLSQESAVWLTDTLGGQAEDVKKSTLAYFDAKSSKRLRQPHEVKIDLGKHEKAYIEGLYSLGNSQKEIQDLWAWHQRIYAFHESGPSDAPGEVWCFTEPPFVRVSKRPVIEIKTENGKINAVVVAPLKPQKKAEIEIKAKQFVFGDFDEYFPLLIQNKDDSMLFSQALKGRAYQTGFGLKLWHKIDTAFSPPLDITLLIPLQVSPEKGKGSHVVGRFTQDGKQIKSTWVGLLTESEIEDNNEILKKIKSSKRAIDRAIPGVVDSVQKEAVTFEPRMVAQNAKAGLLVEVLGAFVLTDQYGCEGAVEQLKGVFEKCKEKFEHTLAESSIESMSEKPSL